MIGKKGKLLILLYLIFLVILFLMCSTDLIIREPEKEVYEVAVIIEDAGDDNYSNFRKGMDQAAIELNADVRFITLYEKLDAGQQMELIERERQDGVDALIVAPVDKEGVLGALSGMQGNTQAVLLDTEEGEEKTAGRIVIDYRAMGARMAAEIKERMPEGSFVLLLEENGQSAAGAGFLEGASSALESDGYDCRTLCPGGEEEYREMLETLPQEGAVILAGSPEILLKTADVLEKSPGLSARVKGLYGRGSTLSVLDDLDSGLIDGLCVTDEFSRGYFSVCMAIEALEGNTPKKALVLDSYYIEKRNLRDPEYEKMLYPME